MKTKHNPCPACAIKNRINCPECDKIYRSNRERELRLEVMEHYGGAFCAYCGDTDFDFLVFDHIEENGVVHRQENPTAATAIHRWLRRNGYPGGFQVLCHQCNIRKRWAQKPDGATLERRKRIVAFLLQENVTTEDDIKAIINDIKALKSRLRRLSSLDG